MRTVSLAGAMVVSIFGFAIPAFAAAKIADADDAQVAKCTFLQTVDGRSVFGERLKEPGLAKAKEGARAAAAKAGATHIVWDKASQTDVTTITGKAYRCPK